MKQSKTSWIAVTLVALGLLALLFWIVPNDGSSDPSSADPTTVADASSDSGSEAELAGGQNPTFSGILGKWTLASVTSGAVTPHVEYGLVTLQFDETHVAGRESCNGWGGPYVFDGRHLRWDGVGGAGELCDDWTDELSLIGMSEDFEVELADELLTLSADGVVFEFERYVEPDRELARDLMGTWDLVESRIDGEVEKHHEGYVTVRLDQGDVSGPISCNSVGSTYDLRGTEIVWGQVITTLMNCPGGIPHPTFFDGSHGPIRTSVQDDTLTFANNRDSYVLQRRPAGDPRLERDILEKWYLVEARNGDTIIEPSGRSAYATFSTLRVLGDDSCRRWGGEYRLEGSILIWQEIGADGPACDNWTDDWPWYRVDGLQVQILGTTMILSNDQFRFTFERANR